MISPDTTAGRRKIKAKAKAKPRAIDFESTARDLSNDFNCALLGSLGMSTRYITEKTGLTPCQVTYRLRAANLTRDSGASRTDFRNGTSPFSATVLSLATPIVQPKLRKFIRRSQHQQ